MLPPLLNTILSAAGFAWLLILAVKALLKLRQGRRSPGGQGQPMAERDLGDTLNRIQIRDSLMAALSADFLSFSLSDMDAGIREALAKLSRFAFIDRATVFQLEKDGGAASATHEF